MAEPETPAPVAKVHCYDALSACASSPECLDARAAYRLNCHRTPFIPSFCNKECIVASKALAALTTGFNLLECDCGGSRLCEFLALRSNHCYGD